MPLRMNMKRFGLFAALVALGAAISLSGCGGGGGSNSQTAPDPTVRFFNGVIDSTAYDFLLNNSPEVSGVAFLGSSADFTNIEPISYDVLARETGTTNEIWSETFTFVRDRDYLISMLGNEDFGTEPLKRARMFRHEVNRQAPNGNLSRVYVINGFNRAAGFLTTPIDAQNPGNNPQFVIRDIAFGESQGQTIDATSQTIEIRRTGTEFVYVTQTFVFEPGKVYALYITGIEGGTGLSAPRIHRVELQTEL